MSKLSRKFVDGIPEIEDSLTSDKINAALSANQGKNLKAFVDGKVTPPPNDGKVYLYYNGEWIELRGATVKED